MKRVAIIGAGPMGLAAAHYLGNDYRCVVFESGDRPGGMSASFDFDGTTIEKYYHFINTPDHCLFSLLRDLGLEGQLRWQFTKMGFFRDNGSGKGQLYPWGNPVALLALRDVPLLTRLRYGLHAFCCKFLKDLTPLDDISAYDWFCRWEGKNGYNTFWKFLFEKKFFELASPLSAAWIASRIRRVANSRESLMQEKLGYLECGSAGLVHSLTDRLTRNGGELHLNMPVLRLTPQSHGGVTVSTHRGNEHFDAVISTIPLPYLSSIAPDLPQTYLNRVRQIRNIGCVCIVFRLAKPMTENFWLNVDIKDWDIPGIIEYSNLRPMPKAYVYVPFYMPHSHPNWRLSDAEMLTKARAALADINPQAAKSEEAARIFRYEYAQPVCPPGFRHVLPSYDTGIKGFLAADTSHSFPEDRSINESARIAGELASLLKKSL